MTAMQQSRETILAEIAVHEEAIRNLRASLPPAIQTFYQFRINRPANSKIMVYAHSQTEAESKVWARLNDEYGEGNWTLHGLPRLFVTAEDACLNGAVGTNLLRCLTLADAELFLRDYEATQKGRAIPGKYDRRNQLQKDIEEYKLQKLKEDAERRPARQPVLSGA